MTRDEAEKWFATLPKEKVIDFLLEYNTLKQHLCARILLVPTGADDWPQRALRRGEALRNNESALRLLMSKMDESLIEAKSRAHCYVCSNCSGGGIVNGESCVCCRGTGHREYLP